MHIYIDETGDTGFKLDKGSSQIFCITILIFNEPKEIEKICQAIKILQEKYKFKTGEEWKFSRTSPDRRIEFLKTIAPFNFRVQAVVMMKKNITGPNLTTDKNSFYNYTCKLVLQYALKSMKEAKVIFDKCGNREFYTDMRHYLRNKCEMDHTKIKDILSRDSQKEIPLQIADMIAGAIGRQYSDKKDKESYFKIIKPRIENLFIFPDDLNK